MTAKTFDVVIIGTGSTASVRPFLVVAAACTMAVISRAVRS